MNLNRALKTLRREHKVNQQTLAKKLDITPQYLSNLETGHHKINIALAEKIAKAFNLPVSFFIYLAQTNTEMKQFDLDVLRNIDLLIAEHARFKKGGRKKIKKGENNE